MNSVNINQSEIRNISRNIQMIQINPTHCVYKVTTNHTSELSYGLIDGENGSSNSNGHELIVQGLCLLNDFNEYIDMGCSDFPSEGDCSLILSQGHIDLFAQYGFCVFHDFGSIYMGDVGFKSHNDEMISFELPSFEFNSYSPSPLIDYKKCSHDNIYDIIEAHPELAKSIYSFDYNRHVIIDLNGDYLPLAVAYSDYWGMLSSKKYDLNLVSQWIKNNSDVVVLSKTDNLSLTQDNLIIDLPDWDDSGVCDQTIEFLVKLNKDEYNSMMKIVDDKKQQSDVYKAIWDIDLIGLNHCATYSKSYYDSEL